MIPAMVPVSLRDLRLDEEFVTSLTHRLGRVIAWGHTKPSGYWSRIGEPRPRWPAVLCDLDGKPRLLSPETVVLVGRARPHWRTADAPTGRWAEYVSARVA